MTHIQTVYASTVAHLDSNVITGGGTDDTAALQAVLDTARLTGGIRLIMDGAALVSGLRLHSGTTIECLNADCGFFQIPQSNCAIVTNADWDRQALRTRNITLIGGTYNQNCLHQEHHTALPPKDSVSETVGAHWTFGLEFYGVENLVLRDLRIVDFRTFAVTIGCFRNVTIEKVWLDLPNRMHAQNQDGFHFWGPGQFLTVRDVGGKVGDDFMNIGPDEEDLQSSITDVLVDGVFLDDADQAIRLLSRGSGLLDRCTIRNVQGTYRSYGFYINSWFPGDTAGNFGDIFLENIHLTHTAPNYDYRPPVLFSVGGDIRCLTLKNIRHEYPVDPRAIGEFGLPFYATTPDTIGNYVYPAGHAPILHTLIIDGLTLLEREDSIGLEAFQVFGPIGNLILKNVVALTDPDVEPTGCLLSLKSTGEIGNLVLSDIFTSGKRLGEGWERVSHLLQDNIHTL